MSDRDLIAEGRAKLAALTDAPSTDRAFELAEWAVPNLPALLDALEAAKELARDRQGDLVITQGRVAELEARVGRLTEWHGQTVAALREARAYAELEAAQRPPLGYVVGVRAEGWRPRIHHDYTIHSSESAAIAAVGRSDTPRGVEYFIAEVREVQP